MLKQASVAQIKKQEITRDDGYIAITMRGYPRGLKRELRNEFLPNLAPTRDLLEDFKKYEKSDGHEAAFTKSNYYARFKLSESAGHDLRHLADLAQKQVVYLVCQCEIGERCHREILMLMAKKKFGTKIGEVFHEYPEF